MSVAQDRPWSPLPVSYTHLDVYKRQVYEQSLYVVPQGQANKKDEKVILQQDLETFEIQNYSLEQIAIYGLSVDSSAIYAVNNMNGQSFVSRIDRTDRTVKTAAYDDLYICLLYTSRCV